MVRDVDTTISNKQALVIPSAGNLAATNGTSDVTPDAHTPAGGVNLKLRVKNVDAADSMVDGVFLVQFQYSTDGGSTFRTNDEVEIGIPAADLAVGEAVTKNIAIGRGFFYEENIAPDQMRYRLVFSTTGHTNAAVVDIEVTAYFDDGGPGSFQ